MSGSKPTSFSPLYQQDLMWVAEYEDGTSLMEWEQSTGKEHLFKEIQKDKLRAFHLITTGGSDISFFAKTGVFELFPEKLVFAFPLCGEELNYSEGLIQFKEASTEALGQTPEQSKDYVGFRITSYNIGWECTKNNVKNKVIFTCEVGGTSYFDVSLSFLDINKKINWRVKL